MIKMKQKNILLMLSIIIICTGIVSGFDLFNWDAGSECEVLCRDNWGTSGSAWNYSSEAACWEDLGYDSFDDCVEQTNPTAEDEDNFNPRDDDWYDVEDWEVIACARSYPYESPSVVTDEGFPYLSEVTYTVLGEVTNLTNPVTGEEKYLYEVSYYLFPWDNAYIYGIKLVHSERSDMDPNYKYYVIDDPNTATATQNVASSGYDVFYLPEYYDQVVFGLQESGSGTLMKLTTTLIWSNLGSETAPGTTGVSSDPAATWNGW